MDRQIVYPAALPRALDVLGTNKNMLVGLGRALLDILGSGPVAGGLACTATAPASLGVTIGAGAIYSLQNIDNSAYSSIAADTTHQIIKQGLLLDPVTLATPAPVTVGQSVAYLIQAAYQDSDTGSTVLGYYNSANPAQPYTGPNNTGASQPSLRQGECLVTAKSGLAAPTGSQTIPAPDAGFVGLYVVTVANGASAVTSANIAAAPGAPFLPANLAGLPAALQSGAYNYGVDTGSVNALVVTLTPALAGYTPGLCLTVRVANTNTGASTLTVNGLAAVSVVRPDNSALQAADLVRFQLANLVFDGTNFVLVALPGQNAGGDYLTGAAAAATYLTQTSAATLYAGIGGVAGPMRRLKITNGANPNTQIAITADEVPLISNNGLYFPARGVSVVIDTTIIGLNGMDQGYLAGAVEPSTWYAVYLISNGTTIGAILSLSFSTIGNMPSGYTYFARIGAMRTDSSGLLMRSLQLGRQGQYVVTAGSNTTAMPIMASAGANVAFWTAIAISGYVPPTAGRIRGAVANLSNVNCGVSVAGNNTWAPPPSYAITTANTASGFVEANIALFDYTIESTNIYYGCTADTYENGVAVYCYGWEDNL